MTRQETLKYIKRGAPELIHHSESAPDAKQRIKALAELGDAQRVNTVTVSLLALETSNPVKKKKARVDISFYLFLDREVPIRLKREAETTYSLEGAPQSFTFDCTNEHDLSDFFKYLYNGSLTVALKSKTGKAVLASGKVPLYSLLRQGSEQVVKGFVVALKDQLDGTEVATLHLMIKNRGIYVPVDIIRSANKEDQGKAKKLSKEHYYDIFYESDEEAYLNDRANPD